MTLWHSRPHVTQVPPSETAAWLLDYRPHADRHRRINAGIRVYFGAIAAIAVLCLAWVLVGRIW